MTFRGTVRNGKVELEPGSDLPEGAPVDVNLRAKRATKRKSDRTIDPAFRISELAVPSGRTDGSIEHDHYIYGKPKRSSQRVATSRAKNRKSPRARR